MCFVPPIVPSALKSSATSHALLCAARAPRVRLREDSTLCGAFESVRCIWPQWMRAAVRLGSPMGLKTDVRRLSAAGQSDEDCDLAEKMITKLLQVDSEECQTHMKQQLRELQALNGTLRDDDFCHICGIPLAPASACLTPTLRQCSEQTLISVLRKNHAFLGRLCGQNLWVSTGASALRSSG